MIINNWHKYFNKQFAIIFLMGLSSGLPLALTGGTLQAWMKSENVDLGSIGLFAMVGLPYSLKFLWAPLLDRYSIGKWGRRRGWMLVSQILLVLATVFLGLSHPQENLGMVAFWALMTSFLSASQDIAIDAWRREALTNEELGWGSSIHVAAYLFAFRMISGALALILSDHFSWSEVYGIMAIVQAMGIISTLLCKEPLVETPPPSSFQQAIIEPFRDFFQKKGALWILLFILMYKMGDNMASQMSLPFYLDLGFTRTEVGAISKLIGWVSLSVGGLIGGAWILRLGIINALVVFGIAQGLSNFGFSILAWLGKDLSVLTAVIAVENFAIGMSTSAFVAFMAALTNKKFTATQYALLTSFMGLSRTIVPAFTGFIAIRTGWFWFFTLCGVISIPGVLIIYKVTGAAGDDLFANNMQRDKLASNQKS